MSHRSTDPGRTGPPARTTTGAWVLVAVLLGVGIVVPLMVFLYDSATPTLFGFPFYYWFQFLMIPVVSLLTYIAFKVSEAAGRRDRQRFDLPTEPGQQDGGHR